MSTIFRDPSEGASARRQDLLRRRRDELVMMPHAIRRVYVARRARTAASLVVSLAGAVLVVTALSPGLARFFAAGLPGINPAVLSTLIIGMWLAGLFAYAIARGLDEHRFAVAMSHYVMPSKDLDQDLERLSHQHPDQMAREMAHRLEVKSAALPVLAASVVLPVTALFVIHAARVKGWPVIADFEASIAAHAKQLAMTAVAGVIVSIVMTRRFARLPAMAPLAGAAALCAGIAAVVGVPWIATGALLAATIAIVVRKLRKERAALQAEDPAAGSEVFTWRGVVDRLRATGRYLQGRNGKIAIGACAFLAAAFYNGGGREPAKTSAQAVGNSPVIMVTRSELSNEPSTHVDMVGNGQISITARIEPGTVIELPGLAGLASVPQGWDAVVEVESYGGAVKLTFDGETRMVDAKESFTMSSCGRTLSPSFGLKIEGVPSDAQRVAAHGVSTIIVKPVLKPSRC